MIADLDQVIKAIFTDPNAPPVLSNVTISFEIPEENNKPKKSTLYFYLYDVHENRELRDPRPLLKRVGNRYIKRWPPLRVDCSYMVIAWSKKTGEQQPAEEHLLLSLALMWLSRYPYIPLNYLPAEWQNENHPAYQPFPIPLSVGQVDGVKEVSEFWAALGNPPRPYLNLVITISMNLQKEIDIGPPVVTKEMLIKDKATGAELKHWYDIGGTVTDANTASPIENAQITLVEKGWQTNSDKDGRFKFSQLSKGDYNLSATANGYTPEVKPITVPADVLNAYDIQLSP